MSVAIVMSSFRVVFLSFCRPVVDLAVAPPSRVAVVVAVVVSRPVFLVLLSPFRRVVVLVIASSASS